MQRRHKRGRTGSAAGWAARPDVQAAAGTSAARRTKRIEASEDSVRVGHGEDSVRVQGQRE